MSDNYQVRKDIEKLFDLVYKRTNESPIALKSELDDLMETVEEHYTELTEKTTELEESKANATEWMTIYDNGTLKLEKNGVNCRLIYEKDGITITNGQWLQLFNFNEKEDSDGHKFLLDYLPLTNYNKVGYNLRIFNISTSLKTLRVTTKGSTESNTSISETLEWTL